MRTRYRVGMATGNKSYAAIPKAPTELKLVLSDCALNPKQKLFIDCVKKRIIVRAGRRGGKTHGVSQMMLKRFTQPVMNRVLYAAPTIDQVESCWFECVNALRPMIEAGIYIKNETEHSITEPGTKRRIRLKTAWNADTLRGDYADLLILDEWQLMNEDAWELVGAPMLLDNDGDAVFIYTPISLHPGKKFTSKANDPQHASKMFKKAAGEEERLGAASRWATFHWASKDNGYISQSAVADLAADMTAIAYRQEIEAEDIDEAPGAMWTRQMVERNRVDPVEIYKKTELGVIEYLVDFDRVVVGVDPSGSTTGDECGIVVAGRIGKDFFVLDDVSVQGRPETWAQDAINAYYKWHADRIVAETNFGGLMVESTFKLLDGKVAVKLVNASRGKAVRAEPVSAVYEKDHGHHVGSFPKLENEMCFVAGTLISCLRGLVPIELVSVNDLVLTRSGYRSVVHCGVTDLVAEVSKLETTAGRILIGKDSHPIYDESFGDFVPMRMLTSSSILEVLPWQDTTDMGMLSEVAGLGQSIIKDIKLDCIGQFGNTIMDQFQKVIWFIIRMGIPSIMISRIWNYSLCGNTALFTPDMLGQMNQGIKYPRSRNVFGQPSHLVRSNVFSVRKYFGAERRSASGARMLARKDMPSSIIKIGKAPVFNLEIADVPEYYANGILVHNCLWQPGMSSPNRMDALVWAGTSLMLGASYGLLELWKRQSEKVGAEATRAPDQVDSTPKVTSDFNSPKARQKAWRENVVEKELMKSVQRKPIVYKDPPKVPQCPTCGGTLSVYSTVMVCPACGYKTKEITTNIISNDTLTAMR